MDAIHEQALLEREMKLDSDSNFLKYFLWLVRSQQVSKVMEVFDKCSSSKLVRGQSLDDILQSHNMNLESYRKLADLIPSAYQSVQEGNEKLPPYNIVFERFFSQLSPEVVSAIDQYHTPKVEIYLSDSSKGVELDPTSIQCERAFSDRRSELESGSMSIRSKESLNLLIYESAATYELPEWEGNETLLQRKYNAFKANACQPNEDILTYDQYVRVMMRAREQGASLDWSCDNHSGANCRACQQQYTVVKVGGADSRALFLAYWDTRIQKIHFRLPMRSDFAEDMRLRRSVRIQIPL